jgi:hypothetical protein
MRLHSTLGELIELTDKKDYSDLAFKPGDPVMLVKDIAIGGPQQVKYYIAGMQGIVLNQGTFAPKLGINHWQVAAEITPYIQEIIELPEDHLMIWYMG